MEGSLIYLAFFGTILLLKLLSDYVYAYLLKKKKQEFEQQYDYYFRIVSEIRYFRRLSAGEQQKFLFRTYLFHQQKKFHYVDVQERPEMPVLISAVAVQLTMGLERFSLSYFKDIYVLQHDYHYGDYSLPFMGHVDNSGIYLSWDNFYQGIKSSTDVSNVGMHEMAHALTYVNFVTKTEEDSHFSREFRHFSKVARPIFQAMQKGQKNLLGDYAATNYHEFWAVSVETFFGNPVRFEHQLPGLYAAMAKLLNQDPLAQLRRPAAS